MPEASSDDADSHVSDSLGRDPAADALQSRAASHRARSPRIHLSIVHPLRSVDPHRSAPYSEAMANASDFNGADGAGGFGLPKMRARALDRLARAYAEDDLDLAEYERRTASANAAASVDQIVDLMRDVPDFDLGSYGSTASRSTSPTATSGGQPAEFTPSETETRVQVLGDQNYEIADLPGGGLSIVTILGDSTVDLSGIEPGRTVRIGGFALLGDLKVIVPQGTRISTKQITILGDVVRRSGSKLKRKLRDIALDAKMHRREAEGAEYYDSHPPRVVIAGFKLLGDTQIIEV